MSSEVPDFGALRGQINAAEAAGRHALTPIDLPPPPAPPPVEIPPAEPEPPISLPTPPSPLPRPRPMTPNPAPVPTPVGEVIEFDDEEFGRLSISRPKDGIGSWIAHPFSNTAVKSYLFLERRRSKREEREERWAEMSQTEKVVHRIFDVGSYIGAAIVIGYVTYLGIKGTGVVVDIPDAFAPTPTGTRPPSPNIVPPPKATTEPPAPTKNPTVPDKPPVAPPDQKPQEPNKPPNPNIDPHLLDLLAEHQVPLGEYVKDPDTELWKGTYWWQVDHYARELGIRDLLTADQFDEAVDRGLIKGVVGGPDATHAERWDGPKGARRLKASHEVTLGGYLFKGMDIQGVQIDDLLDNPPDTGTGGNPPLPEAPPSTPQPTATPAATAEPVPPTPSKSVLTIPPEPATPKPTPSTSPSEAGIALPPKENDTPYDVIDASGTQGIHKITIQTDGDVVLGIKNPLASGDVQIPIDTTPKNGDTSVLAWLESLNEQLPTNRVNSTVLQAAADMISGDALLQTQLNLHPGTGANTGQLVLPYANINPQAIDAIIRQLLDLELEEAGA